MEIGREKMLHHLRTAAALPAEEIFFADPAPIPAGGNFFVNINPHFRFITPLTGRKRIFFASDGVVTERIFRPGEVLFCRENAWSGEVWDRKHSMISVVFRTSYIRALFISHNGRPPDQNGPDVFFHTNLPLNAAGTSLLHAVLNAKDGSLSRRLSYQALLVNVIETLEADRKVAAGKETATWNSIREYMESDFYLPVTCDSIAAKFQMHPDSLSRLVRKMTGVGVNRYLSKLRLEHAKRLLENSNLAIGEIADRCGFQYASYFIKRFREYYADSPSHYRQIYRGEHSGN